MPPATTTLWSPARIIRSAIWTARIAGGADLVDRVGGHLDRQPGADRSLPRGRLAGAALQHLAHDHVLDLVVAHVRRGRAPRGSRSRRARSPPCRRARRRACRTACGRPRRSRNGTWLQCIPTAGDDGAAQSRYAARNGILSPHLGLVPAPRAGRKPGLSQATAVHRSRPAQRVFFVPLDELTDRHPDRPDHPARGLHPAARRGPSGLPARVGRAGPARAALVRRCGRARGLAGGGGATGRAPVVGYLAYDHVARLEPTVPLPPDGPSHPESRFIVADTLVRFDHAAGLAEVVCGDPDELRVRLDAPRAADPGGPGERRDDAAVPGPPGLRAFRLEGEGAHPRRRRLPDRPLPARRAPDLRERDRALPDAPPRQPVAVPLPARARRPGPDRLIAGDAGQGRGPPRQPEPDRRDDAARAGRRRAPARIGEGQRGARHARRPRPQRPLARVPPRHRPRRALHGAGALLARHAPRLRGRRRAARGRAPLRPPARVLPGRHRLGRAEGPRDAADLRARGLPSRPVRRRRRATCCRTATWTPASRSGRSSSTTGSRTSRPAPGSSPTPTRTPSTRSACSKLAALETAITLAEAER